MQQHINQLRRDLMNNPRLYQDVFGTIKDGITPLISVSTRYNSIYGIDDFHIYLMQACAHNAQLAGCAKSTQSMTGTGCDINDRRPHGPTSEWIRYTAAQVDAESVYRCFERMVSSQLEILVEAGKLQNKEKLTVAIDMHLISRYDRKYGSELVRAKRKNGTHVFERYITIQCVDNKRRLVLGVAYMPALENTANFVRKITESAICCRCKHWSHYV